MPEQALITSRDPKGLQFGQLVDAAYNGAHLTDDEAQSVNEQGREVKWAIRGILDRLRKPLPKIRLIENRYQHERGSFEFQISGEQVRDVAHHMEVGARAFLYDQLGEHDAFFEQIWTPEVRTDKDTMAEPVFIGFLVIVDGNRPGTAIITDIEKIDEGMDCEVRFNIKVTVSEFAR